MEIEQAYSRPPSPPSEANAHPASPAAERLSGLEALAARVPSETAPVVPSLARAFAIPKSGVGMLALAQELLIDLAELETNFDLPSWCPQLRQMLSALIGSTTAAVVERDRATLRTQPSGVLRDFIDRPNTSTQKAQSQIRTRAMRMFRALLTLRYLSLREQIPAALAKEFSAWRSGRRGPILSALESLRADLLADREKHPPDSPTARLATVLGDAYAAALPSPFAANAAAIATRSIEVMAHEPKSFPPPERASAGLNTGCDPLHGLTAAATIAGYRVRSGISGLNQFVQPFELERVVPRILARLSSTDGDEALAALMTLFSRVLPNAFHRIPLGLGDGAGLWLDVENGQIGWNLTEIVQKRPIEARDVTDRFVRIPLPREVADALIARHRRICDARSLAELFPPSTSALGVRVKRFLRSVALTSHRPTAKRLSNSWGRFVLAISCDEMLASVMGVDFTLGATANLNYSVIRGEKVCAVATMSYQRLGFSGHLSTAPLPDVGSVLAPPHDVAANLVRKSMSRIAAEIQQLPRRCAQRTLFRTHNVIGINTFLIAFFVSGHRPTIEATLTGTRIDLGSGFFLQTDKRTSPYHEARPGIFPQTVRQLLIAYCAWLKSLAYRLEGINPRLAQRIASITSPGNLLDYHPLFFRFRPNGTTAPLGSKIASRILARYGIARNGGRHFVENLLIDQGVDSAGRMGWQGRGLRGQEAFGSSSAAVPMIVLQQCAAALEDWLTTLQLPEAPVIAPRESRRNLTNSSLHTAYVPGLLQYRPDAVARTDGDEPSPFDQKSIAASHLFAQLMRYWRSRPATGHLGLALSLVFEDGVILPEEHGLALRELSGGVIFLSESAAFADVCGPGIGIRRIWLSPTTVQLAASLTGAIPTACDELESFLAQFIVQATGTAPAAPWNFLFSCARAYLGLRTPGLLYAWMRGYSFSRTTRPEFVARDLYDCCESPGFTGSRRGRRRADDLSRRLNELSSSAPEKLSHQTALARMAEVAEEIAASAEPDSPEFYVAGYCRYLCGKLQNAHTVVRYLSGCRNFLTSVAQAALSDGQSGIDWKFLVASALRDIDENDRTPTTTAINHALAWLGVDVQTYVRTGLPPSAFAYSDRLTEREMRAAVSLLEARSHTVGDDPHLAAVALRLALTHPLRWDEIAKLRVGDVWAGEGRCHVVVTEESGAAVKTKNSPRVLPVDDAEAASSLRGLRELRQARFPNDPWVVRAH